jgi:hypothetical protein
MILAAAATAFVSFFSNIISVILSLLFHWRGNYMLVINSYEAFFIWFRWIQCHSNILALLHYSSSIKEFFI